MKIYQSLADASRYRAGALIPQQILFGLALASDAKLRLLDETRNDLRLGQEFCVVFESLASKGRAFEPDSESAATIASGIGEFVSETDIGRFREPLRDTKGVFDDLLANREADPARIRAASRTMERIADLAKAKLRRRSDSELMAQV